MPATPEAPSDPGSMTVIGAERTETEDRHHREAGLRMARTGQRYTGGRRALVEVLARASRPLTIPEVLARTLDVPQSSAYRNLTALLEAGIVQRISGADDFGRFELAEEISGDHHHHLICSTCGTVDDVAVSPRLERALAEAAVEAARGTGFTTHDHRLDLVGRCRRCLPAPSPT